MDDDEKFSEKISIDDLYTRKNELEENKLKVELNTALKKALKKDYWLQINGARGNEFSNDFTFKWYPNIQYSPIKQLSRKKSKDILYDILCEDGIKYKFRTRWGHGQCMFNFRTSIT